MQGLWLRETVARAWEEARKGLQLARGGCSPPTSFPVCLSNAELIPPASNYGQNPVWSTYFLVRVCHVVCTRTMIKIGAVNRPIWDTRYRIESLQGLLL